MDKWTKWDKELMEAILEGQPVQKQLDIAAEVLSNPVALFDTSFSLICYSGTVPEAVDDPIWKTVLSSGYSSVQDLPFSFLKHYEETRNETGPVLFPDFSVPADNRILFCRLYNEEGPFAILAMDELNGPLGEEDVDALENIQKRLQYSRTLQDAVSLAETGSSSVLVRLLLGQSVPESQFKKLVSEWRWKPSRYYQVMVVAVTSMQAAVGDAVFASMVRRLKFSEPGFRYCVADGNIIGICESRSPRAEDAGNSDLLSPSTMRILDSLDLYAGLSMWFQGYEHLKDGYDQALASSLHGRTLEKRVVCYEDHVLPAVREELTRSGRSLLSFCHPAVLPLVSGQTANEGLFRTLCAYLDSGHHAARAATVLGIHRNTVLYRLRSIEELTGLPLEHPDQLSPAELQHLKLSCILLNQ